MGSLPTLRLLASPEPGLGFDARLRLGYGMNCFMAAESYIISGASKMNFGIEPVRLPWLRLQLTPTVKLMLRFPLLRVSRYKYLYGGCESTLYSEGKFTVPYRALRDSLTLNSIGNINVDKQMFWSSFKGMWKPLGELVHRNTMIGLLGLTEKQRSGIVSSLKAFEERRKQNGGLGRRQERLKKRAEITATFDSDTKVDKMLPELDPRILTREQLKQKLREKIMKKRASQMETGPPTDSEWENKYPVLHDDLRDRQQNYNKSRQQPPPAPSPAFLLGVTHGSHGWNFAT